jgi:quercetin dioxygenase-like cupin family protein
MNRLSRRRDPRRRLPTDAVRREDFQAASLHTHARTAWHTHPLGQILIVRAGVGRVQRWGGSIEAIRPGDVVWIPPGQKHWHGASPNAAMTHIAIQEQLDGKVVEWLENVSLAGATSGWSLLRLAP